MHHAITSPLYDTVMVVHIAVGLVGFGACAVTGYYAAATRQTELPIDGELSDQATRLVRYFRPGTNWAERVIVAVPLLGVLLLWMNHWRDVPNAWPWVGLALWSLATVAAVVELWPAERRIQHSITKDRAELVGACRRAERAASIMAVCYVLAVGVMIAQPHG